MSHGSPVTSDFSFTRNKRGFERTSGAWLHLDCSFPTASSNLLVCLTSDQHCWECYYSLSCILEQHVPAHPSFPNRKCLPRRLLNHLCYTPMRWSFLKQTQQPVSGQVHLLFFLPKFTHPAPSSALRSALHLFV